MSTPLAAPAIAAELGSLPNTIPLTYSNLEWVVAYSSPIITFHGSNNSLPGANSDTATAEQEFVDLDQTYCYGPLDSPEYCE